MRYYVYIYLDPLSPGVFRYGDDVFEFEPFYVGKGSGNRINNHMAPKYLKINDDKAQRIKSILSQGRKPIVIKIREKMESKEAYILEGYYLNTIGKKNEGRGPLLNSMGAAEGGISTHSEGTKKRIAETSRGRKLSSEAREKIRMSKLGKNNPMYKNGKTCGDCYKISLSRRDCKLGERNPMFGVKLTDEQRLKRSINSTRRKTYIITHKDGREEVITGILKYCRDNNLSDRCLRRVLYGKRNHYRGMTIKEVPL